MVSISFPLAPGNELENPALPFSNGRRLVSDAMLEFHHGDLAFSRAPFEAGSEGEGLA